MSLRSSYGRKDGEKKQHRLQPAQYVLSEIRFVGDMRVLCGLEPITHWGGVKTVRGKLCLYVDATTAGAILQTISFHKRTANYERHTTRLLLVIVGGAHAGRIVQFDESADVQREEVIECQTLLVEVAGADAIAGDRTKFDDRIIAYKPE